MPICCAHKTVERGLLSVKKEGHVIARLRMGRMPVFERRPYGTKRSGVLFSLRSSHLALSLPCGDTQFPNRVSIRLGEYRRIRAMR